MALFYGLPLAIAIGWLILLNRKVIADQFKTPVAGSMATWSSDTSENPSRSPRPSVPIPIVMYACFFLISAASVGMAFLVHVPAVVFGVIIRGPAGTAFYGAWCLLFAVAAVGLLKRIRWSYSRAIGLHVFGLANGVGTIVIPNF
jgi:hypothetical protein